MAKLLLVGDLHVMPSNIQETRLLAKRLQEIAAETRPNCIVVLGDQTDGHDVGDSDSHREISLILSSLRELTELLVVLIGNHDLPGPNYYMSDQHLFNQLKQWDKTLLVDTTQSFSVGDYKFCAVPYVPPGKLHKALAAVDLSQVACVFGHQEIRGCKLNANTASLCSDYWSLDLPPFFSGHIHDRQVMDNGVVYVGTPRQVKNDELPNKTVSLITVTDDELVEELITVGLPPRIVLEIKAADLSSQKLPQMNSRMTVKVVCSPAEMKLLGNNPLINQMRNQGATVGLVKEPLKMSSQALTTLDFGKLFYDKIKDNPTKLLIWNELFR